MITSAGGGSEEVPRSGQLKAEAIGSGDRGRAESATGRDEVRIRMATTLALTRHDAYVQALVAQLAGEASLLTMRARLRDVDVHCAFAVDSEEHERRQAASVGAISDRHVLNALLELDLSAATPRGVLSSAARRALRREEAAASVVVGRGTVERVARPPLAVSLVVVTDTQWSRGVDRASRFGPYCSRVLALPRMPADPSELLLEAAYLGIGVASPDDSAHVARAPFLPMRFTSSSWAFLEDAYRQFLDQKSRTSGNLTLVETRLSRA
jgi:hypothetical protein